MIDFRKQFTLHNPWRKLVFANSAIRREAKALLYQELSITLKNGMPLDEALEACLQTLQQTDNRKTGSWESLGTMSRFVSKYMFFLLTAVLVYLLLAVIYGSALIYYSLPIMITAVIFMIFLCILGSFNSTPRVGHVLALRLIPMVKAGHPLSSAMKKIPRDFTLQEVNTIRAGETWGDLPTGLLKLSEFQYFEKEIRRAWMRMTYPVWLSLFMFVQLSFIAIFIIPKFKDIYDQLGAPLPATTRLLYKLGTWLGNSGALPATLIIWSVLLLCAVRFIMTGNRIMKSIAASFILFLFFQILAVILQILFSDVLLPDFKFSTGFIMFIITLPALYFGSAYLLSLVERTVLWIERTTSQIFGYIPIFGAPRKTELESRWLGSLSLSLESGLEDSQAIEAAGLICSGNLQRRSALASDFVKQGHSIGHAALDSGVLRSPYANRLILLNGRTDYLNGLREISEDATRESYHLLNRASRVGEVLTVVAIGCLAGLFAFACYMPIFDVPLILGTGY